MDIAILILLIIGFTAILLIISKNRKQPIKSKKLNLKELAKKTFPKYKIIEKHGTVMICEINHRNEPDELVFIRIEPNKQKSINQFGRRFKAEYPAIPTARELKADFSKHLK
ncbi:hypothetical protein I9189_010780 [Acinetobacter bereziniae]|uniref:hypothetical protein n=1 Tax=Acinetobacter TaxID=469 RepID=UPI0018FF7C9A|nr:hypothetical protein [Acinetobacter bereziniae]MBJ8554830.1 hypothetical protein [Acinetobacter bereziniae]QQC82481.1 hypothetical protein I9192_10660 [Acinetobacter bereziniae]QQC82490.1 hypothetical protein I9192_10710 [Acinetobacter bereziniae]QQC82511.1 hypothetical protein I9192_10825 [Acinetobacter bereziniae]QQC82519.1 hypothetical protein I9192_10870 [Acinetobacter bereziniae]